MVHHRTYERACQELNAQEPSLDEFAQTAYKLQILYDAYSQTRSRINADSMRVPSVRAALQKHLESHAGSLPHAQVHQLPSFTQDELSADTVVRLKRNLVPVVIRAAAVKTHAYDEWNPSHFGERFGDYGCVVTDEGKQRRGTLGEVVEDIETNSVGGLYAGNISNFFNDYPYMLEDLESMALANRLGISSIGRYVGSDLFFGGQRTGTGWHAANGVNLFINIYGKKRWRFISPAYSMFIGGALSAKGMFIYSPMDPNQLPAETNSLVACVPVYETVLEPGDALINPPWWWHTITNLTSGTIAVANRFHPDFDPDNGGGFSFLQACLPYWQKLEGEMKSAEYRKTDEAWLTQYDV